MSIEAWMSPEAVLEHLHAADKRSVIRELAAHLATLHPGLDDEDLVRRALERERLGSTGVGEGVAIPHCKSPQLTAPACVFGRSLAGVDFEAQDDKPSHLFFLLAAPENGSADHLQALATISRACHRSSFRRAALEAPDRAALWRLLREHAQQ